MKTPFETRSALAILPLHEKIFTAPQRNAYVSRKAAEKKRQKTPPGNRLRQCGQAFLKS